jgi:hypothetical protein
MLYLPIENNSLPYELFWQALHLNFKRYSCIYNFFALELYQN